MQPVALEEEGSGFPSGVRSDRPDAGPAAEDGNGSGWRRAARRGWPITATVVVALALGGAQLVLDARERGRLNQLRAVPGVLAAVDPSTLRELWSSESPGVAMGAKAGGDLVRGVASPDGSQLVELLDGSSGAALWSAPVAPPDPNLAEAIVTVGPWFGPRCQPVPDRDLVWCTVEDEYPVLDSDTAWSKHGRTRTVVLDTATGAVVSDHEIASAGSAAVLGDALLIATTAADGAVSVQAWDLRSDQPSWQSTLPRSEEGAASEGTSDLGPGAVQTTESAWITAQGDAIVVHGQRDVWALSEDGQVLRAFPLGGRQAYVQLLRGQLWSKLDYSTASTAMLSLLRADGSWTQPVAEQPVSLTIDDGSAADLCFLSGRARLRAVDCESGAQRWDAPSSESTSGVLLDGTLYSATRTQITAMNASTGELRWRSVRDATLSMSSEQVFTDGESLFVLEQAPATDGDSGTPGPTDMVALSMADGSESWRSPLTGQSTYSSLSISELGGRLAISTTDDRGDSHITRVYGSP